MRGNELLDKLELIDPVYVEAADTVPKKKKGSWLKWCAAAACLCLIVGAAAMIPRLGANQTDPRPGELVPSNKTTAKITYGCEAGAAGGEKYDLAPLTEEEMFAHEEMNVFRGTVSALTNVTIDFNGSKWLHCIATIKITRVYKGSISAGEQITMLIPCPIDAAGIWVEDTGVISYLRIGMEGIFMPWVYDEDSYIEMNGAVLMKQDLAACGLADGMRWVFLDTEQGLVFLRSAYPGAKNATNLDDIEAYVMEMLK